MVPHDTLNINKESVSVKHKKKIVLDTQGNLVLQGV